MDVMPTVSCKICQKPFFAKSNWIERGWGKYCSPDCRSAAQKNGRTVQCFLCGKETYRPQGQLGRSKSRKYFCGKSCQTIWRNSMVFVGSRHANWKGGESAYRSILLRNHIPPICRRCDLKDQRVLTVHHLDHNRRNNHVKNLLWLCCNCHVLVHRDEKERSKLYGDIGVVAAQQPVALLGGVRIPYVSPTLRVPRR